VIPTNAAPITFFLRDSATWLDFVLRERAVDQVTLERTLTPNALRILELLTERGACFVEDIQRLLTLTSLEVQHALWELAAAGIAAGDGFDQLRTLIDPDRRQAVQSPYRRARSAAGRWSLLRAESPQPADALERARYEDESIESAARMLLSRYGVVFRDLLNLESNTPRWGLLLKMFRRLEDRGEVRGGRFVGGFGGEQFALPQAAESLRAARNGGPHYSITLAGADPMNLIGVIVPGERTHALPGRSFVFSTEQLDEPSQLLHGPRQRLRRQDRDLPPAPSTTVNQNQQVSLF